MIQTLAPDTADEPFTDGIGFRGMNRCFEHIDLREKLHNHIQEIHDTIGEDAAILDPSEQLNPNAMYAIYENGSEKLAAFEMEDDTISCIICSESLL